MKIIINAFLLAAAIQIVYFVTLFAVGYVKTITNRPNMADAWGNVEVLQKDVAFGATFSPFLFLVTFLGLSLLCGLALYAYQKLNGNGKNRGVKK